MLQGCPHCAEERDYQEQSIREQRKQTRLLEEAASKAESDRQQSETEALRAATARERARSEEDNFRSQRAMADERLHAQQARDAEERNQRLDAELAQRNYELQRLTTCPYCGQRYDSEVTKIPRIGFSWVGILGRFSEQGVCPRCYYDRLEKSEEVNWTEQEWHNYCDNELLQNRHSKAVKQLERTLSPISISSLSNRLRIEYNKRRAKELSEQIISLKKSALVASSVLIFDEIVEDIHVAFTELKSIDNTAEIDAIKNALDSSFSNERIAVSEREQAKRLADEESARREKAEADKREMTQRLANAEAVAGNSREALEREHWNSFLRSIGVGIFFGLLGLLGGGCYGCLANGVRMVSAGIDGAGIMAGIGFVLNLLNDNIFGAVRAARISLFRAEKELKSISLQITLPAVPQSSTAAEPNKGFTNQSPISTESKKYSIITLIGAFMLVVIAVLAIAIEVAISNRRAIIKVPNQPHVDSALLVGKNQRVLQRGDEYELLHSVPSSVSTSSVARAASLSVAALIDNDMNTAWNSRTGELMGAKIEFELPPDIQIKSIRMTAGFTSISDGKDLFLLNHRIRTVEIFRNEQSIGRFDLDINSRELQILPVASAGGKFSIVVRDTQPGMRTNWREVCVSELEVWGNIPASLVVRAQEPRIGAHFR